MEREVADWGTGRTGHFWRAATGLRSPAGCFLQLGFPLTRMDFLLLQLLLQAGMLAELKMVPTLFVDMAAELAGDAPHRSGATPQREG